MSPRYSLPLSFRKQAIDVSMSVGHSVVSVRKSGDTCTGF